jgi:hypothetical protein
MQTRIRSSYRPIQPLSAGAQEGLAVMEKLGCAGLIVLKYVAPLALVLLWTCSSFGKRKDDVVTMKNGDKFTGEIKALQ